MSKPPPSPLVLPVTTLSGVGQDRAAQLGRLGIQTVGDLLLHRPRRHEDRRRLLAIGQLPLREPISTCGKIVALGVKWMGKRTRSVFEFILEDGTGRLHCRWWNLPWMENYFKVGDEVFVFGKLSNLKPRTMDHPETEVNEDNEGRSIHLNRLVPIYPLTEGLPQRWLRALIWRALDKFGNHAVELWPTLTLPSLPTRQAALWMLHFPEAESDVEVARRRLALDEYIDLQLAIQRRRRNLMSNARGLPCGGDNRLIRPFLASLGFKLTEAQTRVLRELRRDLGGEYPMRRLLQGDVGSGKTVVAGCCALMAMENGFNVALMAPTEILAEQHYQTFTRLLGPLGVGVELRTGSRKTGGAPVDDDSRDAGLGDPAYSGQLAVPDIVGRVPSRGEAALYRAGAGAGDPAYNGRKTSEMPAGDPSATGQPGPPPPTQPPTLFVGTHALIENAFVAANLGLVIIDEQHKFGVAQRERFVRKGHYPHLLVMTATPIPRTLGLTMYGDLDISVIDALPAGRGRVRTYVREAGRLPKVYEFIRQRLAEGRQAYVVYPRVEENDLKTGMKAVLQEFDRVQQAFAPFVSGLLHGRMAPDEKEAVMSGFRANRIQVLVATSVIEVGVDVPNATVMLIENAEQFGLAQLHQLRGRIGRGGHDAYCILVAAAKTPGARLRLKVLEESTDGFYIAEADLRLRGPGELLGSEQSGFAPAPLRRSGGGHATDRTGPRTGAQPIG